MSGGIGIGGDVRVAALVIGTTFQRLGKRFGFQEDNVKNQEENFISMFASFISRKEEVNLGKPLFPDQISMILRDLKEVLRQDKGTVKLVINYTKVAYAFCTMHEEYFRSYRLFVEYLFKSNSDVRKEGTVTLKKINTNSMALMVEDIALALLIWGEAANVRFLPEPLKLLYFFLRNQTDGTVEDLMEKIKNNPSVPDDTKTPFMDIFIRPIYSMIILDYKAKTGKNKPTMYGMPNDHNKTRNYDDLNEQAWTRPLFLITLFDQIWAVKKIDISKISNIYAKTFVEKRGYMSIPRAYGRMCTTLIGLFATLVWFALRVENEGNDKIFFGRLNLFYISLPIALFIAANDLIGGIVLGFDWERGTDYSRPEHLIKDILFYMLISIRIIFKIIVCLLIFGEIYDLGPTYFDNDLISWVYLSSIFGLEVLYFWDIGGLKPYAHLPAFINILLGTSAFNGPLQIAPIGNNKTLAYSSLWILILFIKLGLSYVGVISPMVKTHLSFLEAEQDGSLKPSNFDLTFFRLDDLYVSGKIQAVLMLGPVWLIVGMLFFADIEVFFVVITAITSTAIALHHHVSETAFNFIGGPIFNMLADKKSKLSKGLFISDPALEPAGKITAFNESMTPKSLLSTPENATSLGLGEGVDQAYDGGLDVADSAKNYRSTIEHKRASWIHKTNSLTLHAIKSDHDLSAEFVRLLDLKNFADEFNCIVMSWREEDIISDSMVMELQFVVSSVKFKSDPSSHDYICFPAVIKPSFLSNEASLMKVIAQVKELLSQCVVSQQSSLLQKVADSKELRLDFMQLCIQNATLRSHDWERLINIIAAVLDTLLPESSLTQTLLTAFYYGRQFLIEGWANSSAYSSYASSFKGGGAQHSAEDPARKMSNTIHAVFEHFMFYGKDAETNPHIKTYLKTIGSTARDDDLICPLLEFINAAVEFFKALATNESFEKNMANGTWKYFRDMLAALACILGYTDSPPLIKGILEQDGKSYKIVYEQVRTHRPFLLRLQRIFDQSASHILPDECVRRITFYVNSIKSMTQLKEDRTVLVDDILNSCFNQSATNKNKAHYGTVSTDENVASTEEARGRDIPTPPVPNTMAQFHQPHAEGIPSFTTITPYYNEMVSESLATLLDPDAAQSGLNVLTYLKTIYDQEWLFLEERIVGPDTTRSGPSPVLSDLPLAKISKLSFHNFLDNATQFTYAYVTDLAEPAFLLELYAENYYLEMFAKSSPRNVLDLVQKDFGLLFDIKLGKGTDEETTAILANPKTIMTMEKDCQDYRRFFEERFIDSGEKFADVAPRQRYERFVQIARAIKEVNHWASRRGQTLWRTVTGIMRNEESIINQYLREINLQDAPTLFASPYYRRMFFRTAAIVRDRSIVSKAVYDKLPTWLEDVTGIDCIFNDRETVGTLDPSLVDHKLSESFPKQGENAGQEDPDYYAVLQYVMQELNIADINFAKKLIKAVLFSLGSGVPPKRNRKVSGNMVFGMLNTAEVLARKKFRYLVSVQILGDMKMAYEGAMKKSGNGTFPYVDASGGASAAAKYFMIFELMRRYPGLQVSYVETLFEPNGNFKSQNSKLVNYDPETGGQKTIYTVQLPGPFVIGSGKAENQNHAIIFTRGEGLQALDMNQDLTLEEANKFGSLMTLMSYGKILGFKEVVYTEEVSTMSSFMAYMETIFVSSSQRVSAWFRVRQHYGHPDIFHRIFVITNGGMAKASQRINLSEDIFSGFNVTMRGGSSEHYEFVTQLKGKDVSFDAVVLFLVKVAFGNSEQVLSRDMLRMAHQFDIFRHLSFYFTSVCHQTNAVWVTIYIVVFLYATLCLNAINAFRVIEKTDANDDLGLLLTTLFGQQFVIVFLITMIPGFCSYVMERSALRSLSLHIKLLATGAMVFFPFVLGMRALSFHAVMTYGTAEYLATGRGFGLKHGKFVDVYRQYFEVMLLGQELVFVAIVVMLMPGSIGLAPTLLQLIIGLLFIYAPFVFNPSQFDSAMLRNDWSEFYTWMLAPAGDGNQAKSWNAWCSKRLARNSTLPRFGKRLWYILLPPIVRRILLIVAMCINMNAAQGDQILQFVGPIGCFFLCICCVVFFAIIGGLASFFNNIVKFENLRSSISGSVANGSGDYVSAEFLKQLRCCASFEGLNRHLISVYRICRFVVPVTMGLVALILLSFNALKISFVIWMILIIVVLLYTLAFDIYLSYFACDSVNLMKFGEMPNSFSKSVTLGVHLVSATITIAPVWILSILPFINDLQYRMLYQKDFTGKLAANYEALKSERGGVD